MKKFITFIPVIGLIILYSCNNKPGEIEIFEPTITNLQHDNLSSSSVTLSAMISNDGGSVVNKRGFRLSKSFTNAPTDDWGTDYNSGDGIGEFSKTIEGLEENTTYYYIAYASNIKGYSFTSVSSFMTPQKSNSGIEGTPVVLKKPTLTSIEYSAAGFENSSGTKFNYKMSYTIEINVCDYKNIAKVGYRIGSQIWYWDNPTGNITYSNSMTTMGNTSTLSTTITAYAMMKNGTEYTGNAETLSATYNGNTNGGSDNNTVTHKFTDCKAKTVYLGKHSPFVSYETMASHLNIYGLLIYKDKNSYYWIDFDEKKHTVVPNYNYTDKIYASDIQMGDKTNNYQLKEAYIYISFSFLPF